MRDAARARAIGDPRGTTETVEELGHALICQDLLPDPFLIWAHVVQFEIRILPALMPVATSQAMTSIKLATLSLILASTQLALSAEYVSLAKLVVGGAEVSPKLDDGSAIPDDFYGTNIEILESAALRRKAIDRVKALLPDNKEAAVDLKATRDKNSRILTLVAFGSEPKFTRLFLDAILDEFIALRQSIREAGRNKKLTVMAESIVQRERRTKELQAKFDKLAKEQGGPAELEAEHKRLIEQLMAQRNANASAAIQAEAQAKVRDTQDKLTQMQRLQDECTTAKKTLQSEIEAVRKFDAEEEAKSDIFAIMSRATGAVENQPGTTGALSLAKAALL
jgi:hypothetical protein